MHQRIIGEDRRGLYIENEEKYVKIDYQACQIKGWRDSFGLLALLFSFSGYFFLKLECWSKLTIVTIHGPKTMIFLQAPAFVPQMSVMFFFFGFFADYFKSDLHMAKAIIQDSTRQSHKRSSFISNVSANNKILKITAIVWEPNHMYRENLGKI